MSGLILFAIPIISALIGWSTNRLAIHMLFHPRKPLRFGPLTIQGLIPRRQDEIAVTTGTIIEKELLSSHVLRQELLEIDFAPFLQRHASQLVYEGVAPRLRAIPLLGSFINDKILAALERIAVEELTKAAPSILSQFADEAERHFRVSDIIAARIKALDLVQLEQVVRSIAAREFRAIEYLGAVVGCLIGCLQVVLLMIL
ncbi:MAG: DUF445 family protein [Verrucomicrobia bacterium]|nr:DUF445 family protein [Verrucomicrobiota bacterium]